jgi:membrane protein implicated in regulation of membrane protease activity
MLGFSENPAINWAVLGLLLLGLEMFTGTFVVLFFAIGAFLTAMITWTVVVESMPLQIVVFTVLSAGILFYFRDKIRIGVKGRNNELKGDVGTAVTIESDVAPGGQTEVQYQGARWIAVNETGQTLSKGSAAKVAQVDGVKLILK